jgi:DNA uptake protein ComE-like DNA-binding protein
MSDLNTASPADIAAAGVSPTLARAIALWQPYRCWDDLLLVSDMDERAIDQLRTSGFEIIEPNHAAWAAPKPFKLSAA